MEEQSTLDRQAWATLEAFRVFAWKDAIIQLGTGRVHVLPVAPQTHGEEMNNAQVFHHSLRPLSGQHTQNKVNLLPREAHCPSHQVAEETCAEEQSHASHLSLLFTKYLVNTWKQNVAYL